MSFSPLVEKLMESLRVLPGVGPKTAQRMAMHLLERDRDGGRRLAAVLDEALERVGYCRRCRTLTVFRCKGKAVLYKSLPKCVCADLSGIVTRFERKQHRAHL